MERINLKFKSPKLLNELKKVEEVSSVQWTYTDENKSPLELDIGQWNIIVNDISEKINNWVVNEEKYLMKLEDDKSEDGFVKLNYTFAVSMIGQLTDKDNLMKYLEELSKIFKNLPEGPTDSNKKDVDGNNNPKDKE